MNFVVKELMLSISKIFNINQCKRIFHTKVLVNSKNKLNVLLINLNQPSMNNKEITNERLIIFIASLFIIPLSLLFLFKHILYIGDAVSYMSSVTTFFIILGMIIGFIMRIEDEQYMHRKEDKKD
ncbi:hypothetical protein TCON_1514 [Astathelohania contejeani]|uniref:Uncharacterized protein n=1 Tax=Astathelohania contejeani TaxID=164912 RepID=A0ABQ7HYN1_9MICR|nr:hypothetical protein TCON_1514 [Thelohania contejeani]